MQLENIKRNFITVKKEEFWFIDKVSELSSKKKLGENEKLDLYRELKIHESVSAKAYRDLWEAIKDSVVSYKKEDIFVEFDFGKENFLMNINESNKKKILTNLGIDYDYKYRLTMMQLFKFRNCYRSLNFEDILTNQKFFEKPIYVCEGLEKEEECYGPILNVSDSSCVIYSKIDNLYDQIRIKRKKASEFEKERFIIHTSESIDRAEAISIFKSELLNCDNYSIFDCLNATESKIKKIDYMRSDSSYSKSFLDANIKYLSKNAINVSNKNIASAIIVPVNDKKEFIMCFKTKVGGKPIACFPTCLIYDVNKFDAAISRGLLNETGYTTDKITVLDKVYTNPNNDSSITYIVLAKKCRKIEDKLICGCFDQDEMEYLLESNVLNSLQDKMALSYVCVNPIDKNKVKVKRNISN